MAIAYRIGAIFARFQASAKQTWRASHARRGRRVSRAPRPLHACLKNEKKLRLFRMEAVMVTSEMTPTPLNVNNFICSYT